MPRISEYYFRTAVIFLLVGIGMGLQMAISGNHNVTGAHAHMNLVGWVSTALFGVYFALNPARITRLTTLHYGIHTLGVAMMAGGLYFLLQGNTAFEPLVIGGSLVVAAGVLIFAYILFAPAGSVRPLRGATPAE